MRRIAKAPFMNIAPIGSLTLMTPSGPEWPLARRRPGIKAGSALLAPEEVQTADHSELLAQLIASVGPRNPENYWVLRKLRLGNLRLIFEFKIVELDDQFLAATWLRPEVITPL
jgi:hypothetical protein